MPELKPLLLSDLTNDELIVRFKQSGDRQMVGELFKRNYHLIFGACLKRLESREESKDAVMNIFEKVLQKLPQAKVQSFNSWIYAVITNECMDRLRLRQKAANLKGNLKNFEKSEEKVMEFEGVLRLNKEEEVIHPEDQLAGAIEQLSKEQQTCIRLFFFEEKSYGQIAQLTQFSEMQVKSYLQNGKRRLKRLLEK